MHQSRGLFYILTSLWIGASSLYGASSLELPRLGAEPKGLAASNDVYAEIDKLVTASDTVGLATLLEQRSLNIQHMRDELLDRIFFKAFIDKNPEVAGFAYKNAPERKRFDWREQLRKSSDFAVVKDVSAAKGALRNEQLIILHVILGLEGDEGKEYLNLAITCNYPRALAALMEAGVALSEAAETENQAPQLSKENATAVLSEALLETALANPKPSGKSALMRAILYGDDQLVAQVLSKPEEADINVKDGWQMTALMYAAKFGETQVCKDLVAAGASLEQQDLWGKTAYLLAREGGYQSTAEVLAKAGARTDGTDIRGLSGQQLAKRNGLTDDAPEFVVEPSDSSESSDSSSSSVREIEGPGKQERENMENLRCINKGELAGCTLACGLITGGVIAGTIVTGVGGLVIAAILIGAEGGIGAGASFGLLYPWIAKRNFKKLSKLIEASYMHLGMLTGKELGKQLSASQRLLKFWRKYVVGMYPNSPITLDMVAAQFVLAHTQELFTKDAEERRGSIWFKRSFTMKEVRASRTSHPQREEILAERVKAINEAQKAGVKRGPMKTHLVQALLPNGRVAVYW